MNSENMTSWIPPSWLNNIRKDAAEIQQIAQGLLPVDKVADLCQNLEQVSQHFGGLTTEGVLTVTLLGATGVGKSTLFNALVERPDASPTSPSVRGYTKVPYVAVNSTERDRLRFGKDIELKLEWVDASFKGLALCDTPDVVTEEPNRTLARALVEQSHIIVYVTMPERYSDFAVDQEIRRWAVRKRWLFVLNKFDRVRDQESVKEDFRRRLRELGFPTNNGNVFFLSATNPTAYDFRELQHRLFDTLVSGKTQKILRDIRCDAYLGSVQDAVQKARLHHVKDIAEKLDKHITELEPKVRHIYQNGLNDPTVSAALRRLITTATWQHVLEKSFGFSTLLSWLRWRWNRLLLAYSTLRIVLSGISLYRVYTATRAFFATLMAEYAPYWHIHRLLEFRYKEELSRIREDVRRVLEDYGLTQWIEHEQATSATAKSRQRPPEQEPNNDLAWLQDFFPFFNQNSEVVSVLQQKVETIVPKAAASASKLGVHIIANVPPLAITLELLLRLVAYWANSAPYPWIKHLFNSPWIKQFLDISLVPTTFPTAGFFVLYAIAIAASLVPGWVLLSRCVIRGVQKVNLQELFNEISQFPELIPLWEAREALRNVIARCERLYETASQYRRNLDIPAAMVENLPSS